ncbi:hypothetical protein BpHYR1_020843 [Brachionus plicatilis]|uniref:Uncharacterized protein n=1 Tax=Brachionus plicatilis TaxID=10195 RepID=A0A3M7RWK4_BRAPC|nr:hypothetical protein BpHYR1_020843 [Brachionus plicatilis]
MKQKIDWIFLTQVYSKAISESNICNLNLVLMITKCEFFIYLSINIFLLNKFAALFEIKFKTESNSKHHD